MLIGTTFDHKHFDTNNINTSALKSSEIAEFDHAQFYKPNPIIPLAFPVPISKPRPTRPKSVVPTPMTSASIISTTAATVATPIVSVASTPSQITSNTQSKSPIQLIKSIPTTIKNNSAKLLAVIPAPHQIKSNQPAQPTQSTKSVKSVQPLQSIKNIGSLHHSDIATIDIILDNMSIIKELRPKLCKHLYDRLFSNGEKKKEELSEWIHVDKENEQERKNKQKKYFEVYIRQLMFDRFTRILKISKEPKKYTEMYIRENMTKLLSPDEDISKHYDITEKKNFEFAIYISKKNFLSTILESYPDDTSVIRQFLLDLPRLEVYINDSKVNNIDKMYLDLSLINREIAIDSAKRNKISLMMLVMTMVCQTSFFHSFEHLYKKYMKLKSVIEQIEQTEQIEQLKQNKIKGDSKNNDNDDDAKKNYEVVDFREKNKVEFTITPTNLICAFTARYKILNIKTEETKYIIKTETLFSLDNDLCAIMYDAQEVPKVPGTLDSQSIK
jgi:hypothetical protein